MEGRNRGFRRNRHNGDIACFKAVKLLQPVEHRRQLAGPDHSRPDAGARPAGNPAADLGGEDGGGRGPPFPHPQIRKSISIQVGGKKKGVEKGSG